MMQGSRWTKKFSIRWVLNFRQRWISWGTLKSSNVTGQPSRSYSQYHFGVMKKMHLWNQKNTLRNRILVEKTKLSLLSTKVPHGHIIRGLLFRGPGGTKVGFNGLDPITLEPCSLLEEEKKKRKWYHGNPRKKTFIFRGCNGYNPHF